MTRSGHFVALLSTALLVGSGLCGCENNHEKWVYEGDRRWLDMRSAALLDKAEREFETGDLDLAEQTVVEVLSFDRDNARFYILAGRIALERSKLERSYHLFDTAIKFDEKIPEAYYYQGIVLQRWQQFDRAKDRYGKAYEIEPDNVSYLLAMGEMLVTLGRIDEAIDLFEKKLTYFDQNAALRTAIGHLYSMKDQPGLAADYFGKAALLSPNDSRILEELSLVYLEAKQYGKAIQILTQLIKEPDLKDRDDLKRALAGAYAKINQVNEARDLYVDLARSRNGQASDWVKVGELALKRGDLFAAARAAKQAIQADPQAHEGYLLAGLVQQKRGRLEEALRMFDRAADRNSKVVEPFLLRGIALHKDGHPAAAAQAFSEAIQRRPDDLRAKRLLECVNRTVK